MDETKGERKEQKMDERVRSPKMTVDVNFDYFKKPTPLVMSPSLNLGSSKPSSARLNCLCSPTTHAGSFRCRHHRLFGMPRGGSLGSNLSELATKSATPNTDSLQPQ